MLNFYIKVTMFLVGLLVLCIHSSYSVEQSQRNIRNQQQAIFQQLYSDQNVNLDEETPLSPQSSIQVSVIEKDVPFTKFQPLIDGKLKELFGEWKQLFAKDLKIAKTAAGIKYHEFKGFNQYYSSDSTMDVGVEWRFAIKWPWIKNVQYTGATSMMIGTFQMTGEPNLVYFEPVVKLGLGKGWQPEDHNIIFMSKGFSRAWVQRKSRELIAEIVEKTFKYWGGVANKVLSKKVDPLLPKIDGQAQQLKLLDVVSEKSSITARFSRLTLNLKELIKSQIPPEEYGRLTVTGIQFTPQQAKLTMEMQFLSPPSAISVEANDAAGTVSWNPVETAVSYNLFWSTSPFMAPSTKIEGVSSPYNLSGLTNGTTYFVAISAVDSVGESGYSAPVNFSPVAAGEVSENSSNNQEITDELEMPLPESDPNAEVTPSEASVEN